jgi:hypothetical protein
MVRRAYDSVFLMQQGAPLPVLQICRRHTSDPTRKDIVDPWHPGSTFHKTTMHLNDRGFRGGDLSLCDRVATTINTVLAAIPKKSWHVLSGTRPVLSLSTNLLETFLWKNMNKVTDGHYLLAWEQVTVPKSQGALVIPNLHLHKSLTASYVCKLLSGSAGPCFTWVDYPLVPR